MQGIFVTSVSFAQPGEAGAPRMRFSPDAFGIVDVLHNNALAGAASLIGSCPRLLAMRRFAPFYDGRPSTLSPGAVIRRGA